ncbi:MAG: phosphoribosylglycinamide formyltransferase [Cytophagaceae bacterium]|nr:phosphoribosylglycinamide formyltransferase [Cytophagaceae bacterium]MDW8456852.1 phosphoribosylglycinamide formyltransferase [Cytophagaceae bacterium]
MSSKLVNIAIFCSGSGSNAEKIMEHFARHAAIRVAVLMANKPDCYALQRARNRGVPTHVFTKEDFYQNGSVLDVLREYNVEWIILAGFLWLVPEYLIYNYPDRIVNIHPSLLPKYGGKGMYGMKVHEAVVAAGESKTGITIHYADLAYDEGKIIFQAECDITKTDTPETVALKVQALEHMHYPRVIEELIMQRS